MKTASRTVATFFGVGLVPLIPGTAGSAVAALAYKLVLHGLQWPLYALLVVALFLAGAAASAAYAAELGRPDPGRIVVDEVCGQLIASRPPSRHLGPRRPCPSLSSVFLISSSPGRSGSSEKLPGGWGIMADDVGAGIAAAASGPSDPALGLRPRGIMKTEIIAVGTELLTPDFQDTNSLFLDRRPERDRDRGLVQDRRRRRRRRPGRGPADRPRPLRAHPVHGRARARPRTTGRARSLAGVLGRKLVFHEEIRGAHPREVPPPRPGRRPPRTSSRAMSSKAPRSWTTPTEQRPASGSSRAAAGSPSSPARPERSGPCSRTTSSRAWPARPGTGPAARSPSHGSRANRPWRPVSSPSTRSCPPEVTVTTLASPGDLSIRLSSSGRGPSEAAEARLDRIVRTLSERALGPFIYSSDGAGLEACRRRRRSKTRGLTIACAESCTGGLLGHRITDVPGSSAYFLESAVVYGNAAKIAAARPSAMALIEKHGAVSAAVARAMAAGIRADVRRRLSGWP